MFESRTRLPVIFGLLLAAALSSLARAMPIAREENQAVSNVPSAFQSLTLRGEWLGWRRHSPPLAPITSPPIPGSTSDQHYQGVARSPRTGRAPILYVTRSARVDEPDNLGSLLVIRLGSRNQLGERLRSNRLGDEETKNTVPPAGDQVIKNISFTDYQHPDGIQMVGDILAIPLEAPKEGMGLPEGKVVFFDCSDPENPVQLSYELDSPSQSVGVLGITKLPDEHFLLVTSFGEGEELNFFRSTETSFFEPGFDFLLHGIVNAADVDGFFRTGKTTPQTLNLVNQTDGRIFMVGSSNSRKTAPFLNGRDEMFLYEVTGFEEGAAIAVKQRDRIRHKSLRSKGNFVVAWDPLIDVGAIAIGVCAVTALAPLCGVAIGLEVALSDNFSKQEANFNASGGAYVTPTGELLYYSTSYYNLGEDNIGRMAEFRHRLVSRSTTCGPQFRPNHLGGPHFIEEASALQLDGEVYFIEPWVDMFEDECFNCRKSGGFCTVNDSCNPNKASVMMDRPDQHDDRFDDFKDLDGREGLFGDKGFNDRLTSFRFCGTAGTRLTLYDDDGYEEGNADNFVRHGTDSVIQVGNVGSDFNDEATSARIDIVGAQPPREYAWNLGRDDFFECVPPDYDECKVLKGGKSVIFEAGCGASTNFVQMLFAGQIVGTIINVLNIPPVIELARLSSHSIDDDEKVTLFGSWSDVCAIGHRVKVFWGDGAQSSQDFAPSTEGSLEFTHEYDEDDRTYTITLLVSDDDDTTTADLKVIVGDGSDEGDDDNDGDDDDDDRDQDDPSAPLLPAPPPDPEPPVNNGRE